nr:MAG TPA: deoxyuridine 5'-triphosphate nucleotidohydrolase [Caudoviricetes sp.]
MSLVCFPCMNPFLEEVEFFPDETERGTNGLGSSGK